MPIARATPAPPLTTAPAASGACVFPAARTLVLGRPVRVMGIVNVTPDSFSDGGESLDPDRATDRALRLLAEGADLIDLGAESTRPGGGTSTAPAPCRSAPRKSCGG